MDILPKFFSWYFTDLGFQIFKVWKGFLVYNLNYFSVPTLLKTFFSHWHRYYSPYSKVFDLWVNFESFVFNMMSRIIGAILRTFLIIIGIVLEVFILIAGFLILLFWLALLFLLAGGFSFGFKLLFF